MTIHSCNLKAWKKHLVRRDRLEKAMLLTISERLLKRVKMDSKEKERSAENKNKSMSVISDVLGLSHWLKKATAMYNVTVFFSAKKKWNTSART